LLTRAGFEATLVREHATVASVATIPVLTTHSVGKESAMSLLALLDRVINSRVSQELRIKGIQCQSLGDFLLLDEETVYATIVEVDKNMLQEAKDEDCFQQVRGDEYFLQAIRGERLSKDEALQPIRERLAAHYGLRLGMTREELAVARADFIEEFTLSEPK
jgi:hypothetical protein